MKLAASNIAWGAEDLPGFLTLLKEVGCAGVELAPGLLWAEPVDASEAERGAVRELVRETGLELVGLHALLFTHPELTLFGADDQRRAATEYLKRICALCGDIGGRVLVFGSPASRARGALPLEDANELAAGVFRAVGDAAADAGVLFLIEPLRPDQTDFVTSTSEGLRLAELVDHPNVRLHLDAAALLATAADPAADAAGAAAFVEHVHGSAPDLGPPESSGLDHALLGDALRSSGYDRYVSLEMRRTDDPADQIARSIAYLRRCYLGA